MSHVIDEAKVKSRLEASRVMYTRAMEIIRDPTNRLLKSQEIEFLDLTVRNFLSLRNNSSQGDAAALGLTFLSLAHSVIISLAVLAPQDPATMARLIREIKGMMDDLLDNRIAELEEAKTAEGLMAQVKDKMQAGDPLFSKEVFDALRPENFRKPT